MKVKSVTLTATSYPETLRHLHQPPRELYWLGADPSVWLAQPRLAIVGSRRSTGYGRQITEQFAGELARRGVVIISGLALGIDSIAHRAALAAKGTTVAVLPTALDQIYPASHQNLADQIVERGGALISEYPAGAPAYKQNFIARNRIVAGLADGLLITEAAANSGTMHTARFALEQGKTVMAVPGNVTSPASEGTNNLIKSGALAVTSVEDVCFALGWPVQAKQSLAAWPADSSASRVLELIKAGTADQEELALAIALDAATLSGLLTMLEIGGYIRPLGAGQWALA